MKSWQPSDLNWQKMNNLIPAVIQDAACGTVLMLGYLTPEALTQTIESKLVTFYSRSKQRLWQKGETSNHTLRVVSISPDCDGDSLLILVMPEGPTCHLLTTSCFGDTVKTDWNFLQDLRLTIADRRQNPQPDSYISELLEQGIARIAQKVGEEGVELALASVTADEHKVCEEAADLLFHMMILLQEKQLTLSDVVAVLKARRG